MLYFQGARKLKGFFFSFFHSHFLRPLLKCTFSFSKLIVVIFHDDIILTYFLSNDFLHYSPQKKIKKPKKFWSKMISYEYKKNEKKNEICFLDLTNYSSLLITFNILLTQAKRKLFKDLMFHLTFMLK